MTGAVANPGTPRQLRPVELITDRAKRYRAQRNAPPTKRRCAFCARGGRMDIDHIDGVEANGSARNLEYLCRSCNTRKGVTQKNAGEGKRTAQYNPERPPTFEQYLYAVHILRGDVKGNVRRAAQVLQATPPALREAFVDRIARNPEPPTYQQYARAVAIHQRGAYDEGGAIIHATPKELRSEYAGRIAATKRKRAGEVPF